MMAVREEEVTTAQAGEDFSEDEEDDALAVPGTTTTALPGMAVSTSETSGAGTTAAPTGLAVGNPGNPVAEGGNGKQEQSEDVDDGDASTIDASALDSVKEVHNGDQKGAKPSPIMPEAASLGSFADLTAVDLGSTIEAPSSSNVLKTLKKLVPAPSTMASLIAGGPQQPDLQRAHRSASVFRVLAMPPSEHRLSHTAKKCLTPGCERFHHCGGDFCAQHDAIHRGETASLEENLNTLAEGDEGGGLTLAREKDEAELRAVSLREDMHNHFLTADVGAIDMSIVPKACESLPTELQRQLQPEEISQLYQQFLVLDHDEDGDIGTGDVQYLVGLVETDTEQVEKVATPEKVQEWISEACVDDTTSMTFDQYVRSLLRLREAEEQSEAYRELRCAFWDLRACVLLRPKRRSERLCGWLAKRGTFLPSEMLNRWQYRLFVLEGDKLCRYTGIPEHLQDQEIPSHPLADADGQGQKRGETRVLDILSVGFSLKTFVPRQMDLVEAGIEPEELFVFKVLCANGERLTLAADRATAVEWAANLNWYVCCGQAAREWRHRYGSGIPSVTTLADLGKAAMVLQKIKDGEEITERERFLLERSGLDAEHAEGAAVAMGKAVAVAQQSARSVDAMLFNIPSAIGDIIKYSVMSYAYVRDVNEQIRVNRYQVFWVPKREARACAVCHSVFQTISLRKQKRKHHCRLCGRVVCAACSANRLFLNVTNRMERCCNQCVTRAANPFPHRRISCVEHLQEAIDPSEDLLTVLETLDDAYLNGKPLPDHVHVLIQSASSRAASTAVDVPASERSVVTDQVVAAGSAPGSVGAGAGAGAGDGEGPNDECWSYDDFSESDDSGPESVAISSEETSASSKDKATSRAVPSTAQATAQALSEQGADADAESQPVTVSR